MLISDGCWRTAMPNPLPPLPLLPGQGKPRMTECEALIGSGWRKITAEQAVEISPHEMRCIHCGKPVRVHKASKSGMAAHFEHVEKNVACPLSDTR